MKRLAVVLSVILCSVSAMAQYQLEGTFTTEGIETVIGNTSGLINEPISNQVKENFSIEEQTHDTGFNLGAEMIINENVKSISLPLKYRVWSLDMVALVPYYFSKKMEYSLKDAETDGIGDISLGLGYGKVVSDTYLYGQFDVKLPTGDDEAKDGEFLNPLGTGTTDFVLFGLAHKDFSDEISAGISLSYKMNGSSSKKAEIVDPDDETKITYVDYDITNGNLFTASTYLDYSLTSNFSLGSSITLKSIEEGSTDKEYSNSWNDEVSKLSDLSNKQDAMLLDLGVKATYSIGVFDISAGAKLPVYTDRHEDNNEDDRGVTFFTKFDYSLF